MNLSKISILFAAALAMTSCGGDGGNGSPDTPPPTDPLAFYKSQTVNWGTCSQYFADAGSPQVNTELAKLGGRVQCADIKAPLDYGHPDGLQVSVSMLRVQTAESPEKKPNLFLNPGGPGVDGQKYSLNLYMLLANGSGDSALGTKYKELSNFYNFVGFSPRGVGASTNIVCAGNELVYHTDDTKWGENAPNIQRLTDAARYTASNCQKNPVSDYIHTDATARDMDLMRHLLGDEKLHYYGISYGTWLGFWYAGTFPLRVGPMVLDSNMNFSKTIHDASISYTEGQIHTFLNHIAPYAARHDGVLHMGTSTEAIVNDLNAIGHEINQALISVGNPFRAEADEIPGYLSTVKAAIETQKLADQGKTLDEIGVILTSGEQIADKELDAVFKNTVWSLLGTIRQRQNPNFYSVFDAFHLDNSDSVWNTVVCNDEPLRNKDQTFWIDTAFSQAKTLPIASTSVAKQPCLYWNHKANAIKPSMDSLKDAALLMVQSQFDVPTPLSGAMETFERLPATKMVRILNEGAHGLMVYQTECVDLTVMDYLLGKAPQQRLTECQGKPLPLDPQPLVDDASKSTTRPASHFRDPEMAESLIASLRKATHP